jgi:dipeptide transport system ATP-binding protein
MALLEIKNLSVEFTTARGPLMAVAGLDLTLDQGEVMGVVGESGSGKSVTMLALMGLIPWPGKVSADRLVFDGQDLLAMPARRRRQITGKDVAMIFQEPTTSLNPCFTVGFQIMETLGVHEGGSRAARRARATELLDQVGIPQAASRLDAFPHQLSGGMNQRVMIAMAIACNPRLLIADEPTTALDVTIQAQILDLLLNLQRERGMALILITHDMGVVAETAQRIMVMYAGEEVEVQPAERLFQHPRHPYTAALLDALPERSAGRHRLSTIRGMVPGVDDRPTGCLFNPRCSYADERCRRVHPALEADAEGRVVRCLKPLAGAAAELPA